MEKIVLFNVLIYVELECIYYTELSMIIFPSIVRDQETISSDSELFSILLDLPCTEKVDYRSSI